MRKIIFCWTILVCLGARLSAQYPNLTHFAVAQPAVIQLPVKSEVPPWIMGGGGDWRGYFCVDGIGSSEFSSEGNPLTHSFILPQTGPAQTTSPLGSCPYISFSTMNVNTPASGVRDALNAVTLSPGFDANAATAGEFFAEIVNGAPSGQDYKRTYYCIYSAQYVNHPTQGGVSLAFVDAENRTSCNNNFICQSTINTLVPSTMCPGSNDNDWERYNSFICGAWTPNTQATNWGQQYFPNEMGPIVWPSTGYLQSNGVKFTTGVGNPSSIQYGGYVYVFFCDHGPYGGENQPPFYPTYEEGRWEGIKVARAPLSDALNPRAYEVFYRAPNGVETWHPSLPWGFTKETMGAFLNIPGPKSTDIMGDEGNNQYGESRFSVAQVRNTNYFIGIESYWDLTDPVPGVPGSYYFKKALRYSQDLVHWTDRQLIIEKATDWSTSYLNYPIMLGSDGWSNTVVDPYDFYVAGTSSVISTWFNAVHVYLPPGVSPNSTTTTNTQTSTNLQGAEAVTGVYPNPGTTGLYHLSYTLTSPSQVQMNVLDLDGKKLGSVMTETKAPGSYIKDIDISRYARGIYIIEVLVNNSRHLYKIVYH